MFLRRLLQRFAKCDGLKSVCFILCLAKLLHHQHVFRVHFSLIDFFFLLEESTL